MRASLICDFNVKKRITSESLKRNSVIRTMHSLLSLLILVEVRTVKICSSVLSQLHNPVKTFKLRVAVGKTSLS